MPIELLIARAAYLASWCGACGWKQARWRWIFELYILEELAASLPHDRALQS